MGCDIEKPGSSGSSRLTLHRFTPEPMILLLFIVVFVWFIFLLVLLDVIKRKWDSWFENDGSNIYDK